LSEVSVADDGFELDRGELAEGALPPALVVGPFDPADHRYVATTIRRHHQELLHDHDRGRARGLELRRGRAQ
jgi:hypothetical protein